MQPDQEEWREVPGYPGILACRDGRVHRVSSEGLKSQGARSKPTLGSITSMKVSGGKRYARRYVRWRGWPGNLYVATLVCLAFHGPKPFSKAVVMHLNDDSIDNRAENLRWGSQRDNLNTPTTRPRVDAARRENIKRRWEARKAA
jgi:hypothetical protein